MSLQRPVILGARPGCNFEQGWLPCVCTLYLLACALPLCLPAATADAQDLATAAEMPLYAGGRVDAAIHRVRGGVDLAHFDQLPGELVEIERQAGLRFKTGEIPASDLAPIAAHPANTGGSHRRSARCDGCVALNAKVAEGLAHGPQAPYLH